MEIGNTIKQLRKDRKLSQEAFAEMCGIKQTTLSQIERNEARPNKDNLKKICDALNMPEVVLYLLSIDENDIPDSKKDEFEKYFPVVKDLLYKLVDGDPKETIQ